jgi:hypothetical protein
VVRREGDIAFLESSLMSSDDVVVATATAIARMIALEEPAL